MYAALVDAMRAVPGYRGPDEAISGEITVYDGPEVDIPEEHPRRYLVIGHSGDDQPESPGGAGQSIIALAAGTRPSEENGTLRCLAVCQSGEASLSADTVRTVRGEAYALLAAVDAVCRGASPGPTLGINPAAGNGQLLWALVTDHRVNQLIADGAVCWIDFTITYKARI
jgi:hypothetical protein